MPRTPTVAGWKGAKFGGVDFAKYVVSWEDTRDQAGPVHEYNKRDGGEAERMGRKPHRAVVNCSFIGPTWRDDFLTIQAAIDDNPIQTLTHPVYGAMPAFATSSHGRMDVENAPNLYDVTLTFVESQVDTNARSPQQTSNQGPQAQQQNINANVNLLATYAPLFATAASAIAALNSAAITYATAALTSAQTMTADPTLPQQLANVLTLSNAAQAALAVDPAAGPGIVDPAQSAVELLYDSCTQMADSIAALRPALSLYTTPIMLTLCTLAQEFYGPVDGPTREAEILANNPGGVPDPGFIPAGTSLWMSPTTYVR